MIKNSQFSITVSSDMSSFQNEDHNANENPSYFHVTFDEAILLDNEKNWKVALVDMTYAYIPPAKNEMSIKYHRYVSKPTTHTAFFRLYPINKGEFFIKSPIKTLDNSYENIKIRGDQGVELKLKKRFTVKIDGVTQSANYDKKEGLFVIITDKTAKQLYLDRKRNFNEEIGTYIEYELVAFSYVEEVKQYYLPRNIHLRSPTIIVELMLNDCLEIFQNFHFDYDAKVFKFQLAHGVHYVHMQGGLNWALGFGAEEIHAVGGNQNASDIILYVDDAQVFQGQALPKFNDGFLEMNILCSICEPIRLGNHLIPLLKKIYIDDCALSESDMISRHFHVLEPMYVDLNTRSISDITFHLCDDKRRNIAFLPGSRITFTLQLKDYKRPEYHFDFSKYAYKK